MSSNHHNHPGEFKSDAPREPRRRSPWPLIVVAAIFIVAPFLAWYGTWFGRSLSDAEIEKYLHDEKSPRHVQHALSQIEERISKGDASAAHWDGQIVRLAQKSDSIDVRMTAAWVMGGRHKSAEFQQALAGLLDDPEPIVRRNAARSLVAYADARSRAELRAMLQTYAVRSPAQGVALTVLSVGTPVKREGMLARLKLGEDSFSEVRSPLPGRVEKVLVEQGGQVRAGDALFLLAPDNEQVRDALVGLSYVGEPEDLVELERYRAGVEGMPDEIKREAAQAVEAVKRRSTQKP